MLKIQKAGVEDFNNVISCIKDTYGLSYCRQDIYDEIHFKKKIEQKEWTIFMIEIEEQEETVGVIAFLEPLFCERVYEFGMYAVKNGYRRLGIGTTIFDYAVEKLHKTDHPVEYANVTTLHIAAQKLMENRTEFICTGFLFAAVHEGTDNPLKETLIFYTLRRCKQDCGTLYLPKKISRAARFVYGKLRAKYNLETTEMPLHGKTSIQHHYDEYADTLYLNVNICGVDLIEKVRLLEKQYNTTPMFSVILYLNIKKNTSVTGCSELLNSGYMFSGFKPLYYQCEYAILCSLKHVHINLDEMKLTPKSQKSLVEVLNIEKE